MMKKPTKKVVKAYAISTKNGTLRKFYGNGEFIFNSLEEAKRRLEIARRLATNGIYSIVEVEISIIRSNT